ncbi:MAG: hypothetical protein PVI06_01935 [Desulfobacterales bacterium]|jgi:hypothetical protein
MQLNETYKNVSVSTGTLYVDDLVCNCCRFLRSLELDAVTAERLLVAEYRLKASIYLNDDLTQPDKKNILFTNLFEILEDISPQGCFFGIHPGDPGTLGFWDKSIKFNPHEDVFGGP